MSNQLFVGVTKPEDKETVRQALDAARREHDAPDATKVAALTQVCAAYLGCDGPLGDGELRPVASGTTTFAYQRQSVSWREDGDTVDIPDAARGVSIDTFGDDAVIRYLVPVDGGEA